MAIRAYSELYLNDAQQCLAGAADYAICVCGLGADWFAGIFTASPICRNFEIGNPGTLSGQSGQEMAMRLISHVIPDMEFPSPQPCLNRSPEYWAGWALAYFQWYSAARFCSIFASVSFSEVIRMYPLFHEMDILRFVEAMEKRVYTADPGETPLEKLRSARGFSQKKLAEKAGVSRRMIQRYEQRIASLDQAKASTVYRLARALGMNTEDLLEHPERNIPERVSVLTSAHNTLCQE